MNHCIIEAIRQDPEGIARIVECAIKLKRNLYACNPPIPRGVGLYALRKSLEGVFDPDFLPDIESSNSDDPEPLPIG